MLSFIENAIRLHEIANFISDVNFACIHNFSEMDYLPPDGLSAGAVGY